ncbi:MAG TPA: modification methylase [Spirochaeta sp.]|nr:modification methylase [Spirochaeta sp.]
MKRVLLSPIVKWVGGKRQLLSEIGSNFPNDISNGSCPYYEPFVGGGAVLFNLKPHNAVINDRNEELVNVYRIIRDEPEALINELGRHRNESDYFYDIRTMDRDDAVYSGLNNIERASRIIFLNKTCYNGLYRVNKSGQFNAPFGRYRNPNIVNEHKIRAISDYFNTADVKILNTDFETALDGISPGAFVYFDPPYDPVSKSANFTAYASNGFCRDDQIRLKKCCDRLNKSGVKFLLSNSATDFIRDLYSDYHVTIIKANRAVNSKADKRGAVEEVLVRNY